MAALVEMVVVVEVVEMVLEVVVSAAEGSGTLSLGMRHSVTLLSLTLLKQCHWQVGESPKGVIHSGRTVTVSVHLCFSRFLTSDVSCAKTWPLFMDENWR